MVTPDKLNFIDKRVCEARGWLDKLNRIDRINDMIGDGHYLCSFSDATSTLLNNPQHLSLLLTDQERSMLEAGVLLVLKSARARIEKELEQYDDLDD